MRIDKKSIRAAIKARIDERNDFNLYGRYPSTRWDARLPEWHFYLRNNNIEIKWTDCGGTVEMNGKVIATIERKWSTKKTCLTYRELMPKINWA